MWEISKGASFLVCRGRSIGWLPDQMHFFGKGVVAGVPVPIIIFIAVAAIAYFVAQYTTYGRSVYATGGNPVSAWLSGIQVRNIHFSVYVISGFLAALAALIMAARAMSASMTSLLGLEMDSIAAATVGGISLMGGRGSIIGVVIGAIIIGVVNNGMNIMGAGPDVIGIVKGAIIIIAVAVDYLRRRR
jgi:putative xylitol transport system permease protein